MHERTTHDVASAATWLTHASAHQDGDPLAERIPQEGHISSSAFLRRRGCPFGLAMTAHPLDSNMSTNSREEETSNAEVPGIACMALPWHRRARRVCNLCQAESTEQYNIHWQHPQARARNQSNRVARSSDLILQMRHRYTP